MSRSQPTTYSSAQIAIHWIVAALVVFQIVFGESIKDLGRALRRSEAPDAMVSLMGNLHIWFGVAILVLTLVRVFLKVTRGAPPAPRGSALSLFAMKAVYALFYLLLLAAPVTGLAAWYLGVDVAGDIHEAMKPAFVLLIAVHVLAALWHRFVLKDDVMGRMLSSRP